MLVGISGKKRIGKDTAAHYLEVKYGFRRVGFADVLKQHARKYGWNGKKDECGRKFLQDFGTVVRSYNPRFWIDAAFKFIKRAEKEGYTDFVIPDVRFLNEVEEIKECAGFV